MTITRPWIFALLLLSAGAFGCKSNPAETESTTDQTETPASQEESVTLPIDNVEPTESLESVDLREKHQWNDRVILLFAPHPDHPDYREMAAELAESTDGIEERDLVIYHMFWERKGLVGDKAIPTKVAEELRRERAVLKDAFTFILLGKDGGQKMRAEEAVSVKAVFDEIDSMPMRKKEMKEQAKEQRPQD